jgi:hypothetical protein
MPSYIQIEGDPAKWLVNQSFDVAQLGSQALSVQVTAPLEGTLLVSPQAASVAVFEQPAEGARSAPLPHTAPAIYVPTATGPSECSLGYELPSSVGLQNLASQIVTIMREGDSQTVALGGAEPVGTLVLNGATLSFVVLSPPTAEPEGPEPTTGPVPHG